MAYENPLPPFSIGAALTVGWASMKRNYGPLLGGTAAFIGLSFLISVAVSILEDVSGIPGIFNFASQIFLQSQLAAGVIFLGVMAARGVPVNVGELFRGLSQSRRFWSIAGIHGLLLLITAAVILPFVAVAALTAWLASPQPGTMATGLIVLLILMIPAWLLLMYFLMRFTFAMVLVIDDPLMPSLGILDAMRTSWTLTSDWIWLQLAGLALILALILMLTAAACLLPALFLGGPLAIASWGAAYAMIVDRRLIGRCRRCGYSLEGLTGAQCPECGEAIPMST